MSILAMVIGIGGCQTAVEPPPRPAVKSTGSPAPIVPIASQVAGPFGGPSPASPADPTAVPPALLQRPTTPFTEVSGVLHLDAAYLTGKIKARVVANNGGNVVAVGPADLIVQTGGVILSNNGGGMISKIRNSSGGGELISKLRYHLLEEPAQGEIAALSIGTILPAAGMAIAAQSMRTGQFLPIGADAAGQPVYAIASNATGAYTLYLPAEERGNVLIVALAPASTDEKLTYSLVTPTRKQAERVIDEDTSLVTSYVLRVAVAQCTLLISDRIEDEFEGLFRLVAAVPAIRAITLAANEAKVKEAPPAEIHALGVRLATGILARLDLAAIQIPAGEGGNPARPALVTLENQIRLLREGTRTKLMAKPGYFVDHPDLAAANRCLAPADRYVIQRPTDLGEFLIRAYLTSNDPAGFQKMQDLWGKVLGAPDPAKPAPHQELLVATHAILQEFLAAMLANRDGLHDEALALVRGFKAGQSTPGDEPTVPLPLPVCR